MYLQIEDHDPGVSLPGEIDEYSQSMPQNHLLAVFDADGRAHLRNSWRFASLTRRRQTVQTPLEEARLCWPSSRRCF